MDIECFSSSYNTFGGSRMFSYVGDLLTVRLGDYGTAVESVEVVAHLRSAARNPRPTLEELFDRFHESLNQLPKIRFQRNLRRVEIRFLSERFTAEDNKSSTLSPKMCNIAAAEVAAALPLIRRRIQPKDDFGTERFLSDAAWILSKQIESVDEWEQIRQQAHEKRHAIDATKSPWELLEIDWDDYHPQARHLLDDPFFWETASDLSPNGNDTGFDLLEDFRHWNQQNRNVSPLAFLDWLMTEWGVDPIDWNVTDRQRVRTLRQRHPIPLLVCNEASIALAFAVLKLRATCPPDVVEIGLAGLARTEVVIEDTDLSDETRAQWTEAISKMRAKLESLL